MGNTVLSNAFEFLPLVELMSYNSWLDDFQLSKYLSDHDMKVATKLRALLSKYLDSNLKQSAT